MQNLHHLRVTSKRRKWMIAAASAIAGIAVFMMLTRFSAGEGPVYNGRHLSEWTEAGGRIANSTNGSYKGLSEAEVRAAVVGIGSNAAPYLVKWIQHEESSLRGDVFRILLRFMSPYRAQQFTVSSAHYRASGATLALSSVCTNLGPDELAQLALFLTRTNSSQAANWVAYVLSCQSSAEARQLALAWHQPDRSAKLPALQFLRAMRSRGELNLSAKDLNALTNAPEGPVTKSK